MYDKKKKKKKNIKKNIALIIEKKKKIKSNPSLRFKKFIISKILVENKNH